jgi:hypothetical protein
VIKYEFVSPFEAELAKFFDENGVEWEKGTKRFPFKWNGKKVFYVPDFYLPKWNLYLEAKGRNWRGVNRRTAHAVFVSKINWQLIDQKCWDRDKSSFVADLDQFYGNRPLPL